MKVDAVCFDLDGTLVDSRPGIETSLRAAVAEVLPGRTVGECAIGPALEAMLEEMLPDERPSHAAIAAAFRRRYDSDGWRHAAPYPGIGAALDALSGAGLRLDVVTNKRSIPTRMILAEPAFAGRFSLALSPDTFDPVPRTKAEVLSALLALGGLVASRVAYVGDSPEDRHAARTAGCDFVAVEWGYGRVAEVSDSGDLGVVASPSELSALLLSAEQPQ